MKALKNWMAAAVMAMLIAASWQLDGPSEIEVMQAVAAQVKMVEATE